MEKKDNIASCNDGLQAKKFVLCTNKSFLEGRVDFCIVDPL